MIGLYKQQTRKVSFSMTRSCGLGVFIVIALAGFSMIASADSETLIYDLKGNITSRTNDSGTSNFQYDALDRLTDEQGPHANQAFTYDANGNRLTDGGGAYIYAPSSNVMTSRHGNTVAHDAAGNMIDDGAGLTFDYNNAGRLKRVYDGGILVATYTYNAFGQRTRKVTASGTTLYHYDLDGQLIEESLDDSAQQLVYVWRDNKPTSVIYASGTQFNSGADEWVVYLHTDHLNTARWATDIVGSTVWVWESDAHGATVADEDADGDGQVTRVNLRFPGQYEDLETNLIYNWHRYYQPGTGRFTQSDRIGLDGGDLNLFRYAANNPIGLTDPNGQNILGVGTGLVGVFFVGSRLYLKKRSNKEVQTHQDSFKDINRELKEHGEACDETCGREEPEVKISPDGVVECLDFYGDPKLYQRCMIENSGGGGNMQGWPTTPAKDEYSTGVRIKRLSIEGGLSKLFDEIEKQPSSE